MHWLKTGFLIEGAVASNYMFVTMSCLSYYSILSPCKVINDTAEKYSLLPKFNWDYICFDIMTPNSSFFHWQLIMTSNPPKTFQ